MAEIHALAAGGNVCILLESNARGSKQTIVRVAEEISGSSANDVKMQKALSKAFYPFVPRIVGPSRVYTKIPKLYMDVMRDHKECVANIDYWNKQPKITYRVTKIEYANLGPFGKYKRKSDYMIRKTIFDVLCFLYLAQAEYGFSHGDLNAENVVMLGQPNDFYAQVIDFDFAALNAEQTKDHEINGDYGVRYVAPPEVLAKEDRWFMVSVLGSIDLWSLGVMLLGTLLGNYKFLDTLENVEPGEEKLQDRMEIVENIHWIQVYLNIAPKNAILSQEAKARMKRYKEDIESMEPETTALLQQLLHPDPMTRIMHGNYYRLLQESPYFEPLFKDGVKRKAHLQRLVLDKMRERKYVNTLTQGKEQIRSALRAGLLSKVACVRCGEERRERLGVCAQYGFIVCGASGAECQQLVLRDSGVAVK